MTLDLVEVWVDGLGDAPLLAGRLRPSFQGGRSLASSSFEYDSGYLSHPAAYSLSPDLSLASGRLYTPANQTLFGAFADASPDEWGQKIVDANHAALRRANPDLPRRIGEFDYLLGVSDHTRPGALRLRDPATGDWLSSDEGAANFHEIDRILEAARRYESNTATDEDIAYLGDVATSPGGARPKANLTMPNGRLALAKLPHSKDAGFDVEGWEAVALDLADRSGIRTPARTLLPAGAAKSVLVLDRFDRTESGQRIGYLSAATALHLGSNDDRRVTYEEFTDTIAEFSADPRADLREMFLRIALSVLITNVDDHWRNHGFLRGPGGWRLSPVFDLNPTVRGGGVRARAISDADDPGDRDVRRLLEIAASFRLSPPEGVAALQQVGTEVERWRQVAAARGIPDGQQVAMSGAFRGDQLTIIRELGSAGMRRPRAVPSTESGGPADDTIRESDSKSIALARLGRIMGRDYRLGIGSSVPSAMFTDAARFAGVATDGSMPERAERVVVAAGLVWEPFFDSRSTPSGGGSTVTLAGLNRLVEALLRLSGADSDG